MDGAIELDEGRTVGFATFGSRDGTPVLWCHGGPGSRLDPVHRDVEAANAGLLLVGIDRPGYGISTPQPGRTIADWIPDAMAVADELGVDKFVAVGESTGGAYALALAALVPDRSLGVVACCSLTDTRREEARATMSRPHCHAVWDAPDRRSAMAAAVEAHGIGGSKMTGDGLREALSPSDVALFREPLWAEQARAVVSGHVCPGTNGLHRRPTCRRWGLGFVRCHDNYLSGDSTSWRNGQDVQCAQCPPHRRDCPERTSCALRGTRSLQHRSQADTRRHGPAQALAGDGQAPCGFPSPSIDHPCPPGIVERGDPAVPPPNTLW